jgi:hypothetical protein
MLASRYPLTSLPVSSRFIVQMKSLLPFEALAQNSPT